MRLVIVTGVSGAGKTVVLHALEDLGFFVVDNLPVPLASGFLKLLVENGEYEEAAIGLDIRNADFLNQWKEVKKNLVDAEHMVEIIFLDANDNEILNRFKKTRRPHPLGGGEILLKTIRTERDILRNLINELSWLIDSSNMTVHELRAKIFSIFDNYPKPPLIVNLVSFGFSNGIPMDSDLMFDVRFLPNPYFVKELSDFSGRDPKIKLFLSKHEEVITLKKKLESLLAYLLPEYQKEGKSYLTCSIGCTGGRHRSVYLVEELESVIVAKGFKVNVLHRDINNKTLD
jgi:RNase adapter protein RapZ